MDGMGVRTRFYRPTGLAADYRTRNVYVADAYNHRVRVIELTAIFEAVEDDVEEWHEVLGRAFRQNFIFILIVVGSTLVSVLLVYLCCRFCECCPLYRRRLHKKRMNSMTIGNRAGFQ